VIVQDINTLFTFLCPVFAVPVNILMEKVRKVNQNCHNFSNHATFNM